MTEQAISQIGKRFGDTSDLPEELRKLLKFEKLDDLEEKIISTIKNRYAGAANVDEVMVGLYRDFQYIPEDRRFLANKLYRMAKQGVILSVEKKKGAYQLK